MVRVQLAGLPIQMNNRFPDLALLCRGYETEAEPLITLETTGEEILREKEAQADSFTDGYLETVCLYRKLALEVLKYGVFLMHASVIEVDGKGYAFLAPSGTGKTTQTRLWLKHFGSRARVINGDKPLIRVEQGGEGLLFRAYGTPWCGKEGLNCNASVPLRAIFLVERAEQPSCVPASETRRIDSVFRQLLMPQREAQMDDLLRMAGQLIETVPTFVLRCNMEDESVKAAWEAAEAGN